jgi:zinc protease
MAACAPVTDQPKPVADKPAVPSFKAGVTYGSSSFVLDNGMEVVIVPIANAPIVHMQFTYRVGSNDEEAGKSGLAHYLEHLMFRAGEKANAGHLEQVAQAGGSSNAYTSNETTSYYNAVPPEKFEETLKREATRIGSLTNDEAAAAVELDVVKREKTQRRDSTAAKFFEKLLAALWGDQPNARPVIGTDADLNGLTLADARLFHAKWYGASNIGLVITGKTTVPEAYGLVMRYLAPLPRSAVPERVWRKNSVTSPKLAPLVMSGPDVGTPSLLRARLIAFPDVLAPANQAALLVATQAIAGSADSRLTRPMVYGQPVATGVGFSARAQMNGSLWLSLSASPLDLDNLSGLSQRLDAELDNLRAKPLTEAEVEKVKKRYLTALEQSKDKPSGVASTFSGGYLIGQAPVDTENWPNVVRAVNAEQANAALKAMLSPGPWLDARLLPREATAKKPAAQEKTKKQK